MTYLISTNEMNSNTYISKVYQPVWLIKPEPGKDVPRGLISKSRIAKTATTKIEEGGKQYSYHRCLFNGLILSWW
jgi:hypothetical protein